MVTKIRLGFYERIAEFCKEAINKEPASIASGLDFIELTFDPPLSTTEKAALNNAMPDIVKKLFKITVTEE